MKKILLCLVLFFYCTQVCLAKIISFDLDETLIASDRLKDSDIKKAEKMGYEVEKSKAGQYYIVRPGAFDILEYCKAKGLSIILITSNTQAYAFDILDSSGLLQYFDRLIAQEDLRSEANRDFEAYPNHRNISYPQKSWLYNHTTGFFKSFVVRAIQRGLGNSNIHPYVAATNTAKYPPQYGSRVHIDNSLNHVDKPIDFVGIKVNEFTGLHAEPKDQQGNYYWVNELKSFVDIYTKDGWAELYYTLYNKAPIQEFN